MSEPYPIPEYKEPVFVNIHAVNLKDLANSRPGTIIRVEGRVTDNVRTLSQIVNEQKERFWKGFAAGVCVALVLGTLVQMVEYYL